MYTLQDYEKYRKTVENYSLAMGILSVDRDGVCPKAGYMEVGDAMAMLAAQLKALTDSDETLAMLKDLEGQNLPEPMATEIKQVLKTQERSRKVPADFFQKYRLAYAKAALIWQEARAKADYGMFKDTLKELVELQKQMYAYYGYPEKPYDAMLDDREPGMKREQDDALFSRIRQRLVPFIHRVQTEGRVITDEKLHGHFPKAKQQEFLEVLKAYLGFDESRIAIGETAHPVTNGLTANDVRFSVRYHESDPTAVMFSLIHEYGHAQYALHIAPELQHLALSHSMSSGMHESQSRMLENYIGKRPAFWKNLFPKLQEIFPEQWGDLTMEEFLDMINLSAPTPVRIYADELTYPLHVAVRYELEKEMMDGTVDFDTLNTRWDDMMEEYLGIRPKNDAEGILQDMHWAYGLFGYFPTYVLGSAYSAQFIRRMEQEIDVDGLLEKGQFTAIADWLGEKIQRFGGLKDARQHLQDVCGEDFDPDVYIDYLIDKYSKLYGLD